MTKSGDLMATVSDAVVQGKFMFLSGEICLAGNRPMSSKALDDQAKMRDIPLVWLSVTLMEYQAPHADFESSQ